MEKYGKLAEKLEKEEGKILILPHDYPDPDAIASAYAWKRILEDRFGFKEVDIKYYGEISHNQNKILVKKLDSTFDFKMAPIDESLDFSKYNLYFLVDHQYGNSNSIQKKLKKSRIICFDHHLTKNKKSKNGFLFSDLRCQQEVGSTSTIAIEYLKAYGIELKKDDEKDRMLATALLFGIYIDTKGLMKSKGDDHLALAKIVGIIDQTILHDLIKPTRSEQTQTAIGRGLFYRKNIGKIYCVGCAGYLKEDNRDAIADLAEELIEESGIEVGIAYTIVDKNVEISIRTTDSSTVDASKIAEIFGGGGRPNAAAAKNPLGNFFEGYEDGDEKLLEAVESSILTKIREKIGESKN